MARAGWFMAVALTASCISPVSAWAAQSQSDSEAFGRQGASEDARDLAAWILASSDNRSLPFVIIDKIEAKVFVFDRLGQLQGAAPALLGLGRGDDSVSGIGQRKLATIRPDERTTPAGRFQASLGHDFEQDILWVDYAMALSLHRVVTGNPGDRRRARLASATPNDNRISYGCINVPADFYDSVVVPAFTGTVGIVYILPETKPLGAVFAIGVGPRPVAPSREPTPVADQASKALPIPLRHSDRGPQ